MSWRLAARLSVVVLALLVVFVGALVSLRIISSGQSLPSTPAPNAGGPQETALGGVPAPDFTLTDQFGHAVTLSSLRGHEVVLAFIDSRCTDVCPLTAQIMRDAKARLSASAASQVALVAVNANPAATSIADVQAWSIAHGMLHQWVFLTGTASQLEAVYHLYDVYVQGDASGQVVHEPVTFIIDAQGRERLSFWTLNSKSRSDLGEEISGLEAGMQQWLPQPQ